MSEVPWIIIGVAWTAVALSIILFHPRVGKVKPGPLMPVSDPADLLIRLIESDPANWTSDDTFMKHPTGAVIWIANESYGLGYRLDGGRPGPRNTRKDLLQFKVTDRDGDAIWAAVSAWQKAHHQTASDAALKAFAHRIIDHFEGGNVVPFKRDRA